MLRKVLMVSVVLKYFLGFKFYQHVTLQDYFSVHLETVFVFKDIQSILMFWLN